MLKKRICLLVVMLLLLVAVTASERVNADVFVTCAATCGGCEYGPIDAQGATLAEIIGAMNACCQSAKANTPLDCSD